MFVFFHLPNQSSMSFSPLVNLRVSTYGHEKQAWHSITNLHLSSWKTALEKWKAWKTPYSPPACLPCGLSLGQNEGCSGAARQWHLGRSPVLTIINACAPEDISWTWQNLDLLPCSHGCLYIFCSALKNCFVLSRANSQPHSFNGHSGSLTHHNSVPLIK